LPPGTDPITELLQKLKTGDRDAEDRLIALVYNDLRRLAERNLRNERPEHTLQATALVHEAYLRLTGKPIDWQNRAHFFAVAAQQMRRILVDYARAVRAKRRGSGGRKLSLDDVLLISDSESEELIDIDASLNSLAEWDARQAKVVELRFFGGLTEEEIASVLGVSTKTVKRDWNMARAWLQLRLGSADS
jgi:RNA polymerase sigma factor (TIGR02999 family)